MSKENRDLVLGGVTLSVSIIIFIASFSIRKLVVSRIGAAFVPQLAAVLLGAFSTVVIVQALLSMRRKKALIAAAAGSSVAPPTGTQPAPATGEDRSGKRLVAVTIGLLILYAFLLDFAGFILSTAIYLFLQFVILTMNRKRNFLLFALISAVVSIAIYAIFVYGFELMLPAGLLG